MTDRIRIIVGAGALSIKKLKYTPKKLEINVTNNAINIIILNCFVIKNAIAPGVMRRPIDKTIPCKCHK